MSLTLYVFIRKNIGMKNVSTFGKGNPHPISHPVERKSIFMRLIMEKGAWKFLLALIFHKQFLFPFAWISACKKFYCNAILSWEIFLIPSIYQSFFFSFIESFLYILFSIMFGRYFLLFFRIVSFVFLFYSRTYAFFFLLGQLAFFIFFV